MPALFGIVCNDGIVSDAEITAMQKAYAREDREIEIYKISEKVTFACCYFKYNKEVSYFLKPIAKGSFLFWLLPASTIGSNLKKC